MMYICSHKPNEIPYSLQCKTEIIDNNLDDLHEGYRHLRGMHYLYTHPNDLQDEIGIFQHRRFMQVTDLGNVDCVVPHHMNNIRMSVYNQFCRCHYPAIDMFKYAEDIIGTSFKDYVHNDFPVTFWHNIFIMNKTNYMNYCQFLFSVLEEIDKKFPYDGNPWLAWIGERLGSFWIINNCPNILSSPITII